MPAVFETAPAATAIPITFATKATWEAVKGALPAEARQFAEANGFAAKPGKCLILPGPDRARDRRARHREALRREVRLYRGPRAEAEFSADPCRRHGLDPLAAADRFHLGRSFSSQGDTGRQGRLLRHRRARSKTVERH